MWRWECTLSPTVPAALGFLEGKSWTGNPNLQSSNLHQYFEPGECKTKHLSDIWKQHLKGRNVSVELYEWIKRELSQLKWVTALKEDNNTVSSASLMLSPMMPVGPLLSQPTTNRPASTVEPCSMSLSTRPFELGTKPVNFLTHVSRRFDIYAETNLQEPQWDRENRTLTVIERQTRNRDWLITNTLQDQSAKGKQKFVQVGAPEPTQIILWKRLFLIFGPGNTVLGILSRVAWVE